MTTPGSIIQAADAYGFGWIAWAWDDDYTAGDTWFAPSRAGAFSLSNGAPAHGAYLSNSDLTLFGNDVILRPAYGTFSNAQPATSF
jgi:hypothetical protein